MLVKLSEYADMLNVSYITVYRWFKEGRLSDPAHQTESGTILVEVPDKPSITENNSAAMSMILKKVVECRMNNIQIEDFASWILSTFSLKLHETTNLPKYSKSRPDVQNHFKKFIPNNEELKQKMQALQQSDIGNKITVSADDYVEDEENVPKETIDNEEGMTTEKLNNLVSLKIESIKDLDPVEAANILENAKNVISKFRNSDVEDIIKLKNDKPPFDAIKGKGFIKRGSRRNKIEGE